MDTSSAVPLCIPDNYEWDDSQSKLKPRQGVKRSGLKLCEQGLRILKSARGPLCVVCVVGPARTGKSYLLTQLQGSVFRLGHSFQAETMGIWIGSKPIEHSLRSGEKITVVFLDSEGIGSVDSAGATESTDNQIFTLSVLISSLLIYNSKLVPTSSDLEKLHYVSKLSDSIRMKKHGENTTEDVEKFKESSPEFFWLIRDVTLTPTVVENEPCDVNTYLQQKVLKEERTLSEATRRKNEIRRNIKSFFKSVDAFALPPPSDQESVTSQMDKPEFKKLLNKEFVDKMETLKGIITEKYCPKKSPNGVITSGNQLAEMIESYVMALNCKGYIPDWQSTWDTTVQLAYQRASETAFSLYESVMSELRSSFPCEEEDIMSEHELMMEHAVKHFKDETLLDPDVEQFHAHLKDFTKRCASFSDTDECNGGLLLKLLKENREISAKFCDGILQDLVKDRIDPVFENMTHETSFDYIMCVVHEVGDQYRDTALGPAADEIYQRYLTVLEQKKQEAMRIIIRMQDYHGEIEEQKYEKARLEAVCRESELQNDRLLRQRESSAKQHMEEVRALKAANETRIRKIQEESDEAVRRQYSELQDQHAATMRDLRSEFQRSEAQRHQQMQQLRQQQASLDKQLAAANQKIGELKNRPPKIIHEKSGGCSVM